MIDNKDIFQVSGKIKKVWSKPKLITGKEIEFFGLGRIQGPTTTPATS